MTKDGDMRMERCPLPMTILISTQDVGAFQGSLDALLQQLFSGLLGLFQASSQFPSPHLPLQAPPHSLPKVKPEFQKTPLTLRRRLLGDILVPSHK